MKTLIRQAVQLNKQDNATRYVFYSEGEWHVGMRLPSLVDYREFYVVEHGTAHAVCL